MSKDSVDNFNEGMQQVIATERLKSDTESKKAVLDNKIVNHKLNNLLQNEKELEIAKNSDYGALSVEKIKELQIKNDEYMEAAKSAMTFIGSMFGSAVPFFKKNFILIGAATGEGKSTAVANIAFEVMTSKDADGKTGKVLVLTNEECAEDFYNRITAIAKGWHYVNHSKFTEEQKKIFSEYIPILASNGRLTVIDNTHGGSHGVTTSIEGIEAIFENLLANKIYYDAVIIDYYQNITYSKNNPDASENEVQAKLARLMDKYKNEYPAPIVMMAQVNKPDKDDKTPFQHRIKGRKIIMDPATCVLEMIIDRKNLHTQWTVWKSRFTEAVGNAIDTGYSKGKFVEYDNAFIESVQKLRIDQTNDRMNRQAGQDERLKEAFGKEKKDGNNV